LFEGENQAHGNMIRHCNPIPKVFIAARTVTLSQMKSPSQSCFHAEIGVNLLWSLKKQERLLWLKLLFILVNMHYGAM